MLIVCGDKTVLDIAVDISNVIVGFCTLFLAFYIFVYQKRKDKNDTKLEWVKELIINPRFENVVNFYRNIYALKVKFINSDLSDQQKIEILDLTKSEFYVFRDSFMGLLQFAEPSLYKKLHRNVEKMLDNLANVVDNDELKLNIESVYDKNFKKCIDESYELTIKTLFSYNGEV